MSRLINELSNDSMKIVAGTSRLLFFEFVVVSDNGFRFGYMQGLKAERAEVKPYPKRRTPLEARVKQW